MSVVLKGQAIDLEPIEKFLDEQIKKWKEQHPNMGGWHILTGKVPFKEVVRFMMDATDDLIVLVEGLIFKGEDKKATVIKGLEELYDAVIEGVLPVWLKPFSSTIKYLVINVFIDKLIDYIVARYNDGSRLATALAWKVKTV